METINYYRSNGEDCIALIVDGEVINAAWGVPSDRRETWVADINSGDVWDYFQRSIDSEIETPVTVDAFESQRGALRLLATSTR